MILPEKFIRNDLIDRWTVFFDGGRTNDLYPVIRMFAEADRVKPTELVNRKESVRC
jgi:hypothetical protein